MSGLLEIFYREIQQNPETEIPQNGSADVVDISYELFRAYRKKVLEMMGKDIFDEIGFMIDGSDGSLRAMITDGPYKNTF